MWTFNLVVIGCLVFDRFDPLRLFMLGFCADRMAEALDKFQVVPQTAAGFFWTAGHKGERRLFVDFLKNSSGRCSTTAGSVQAAAAFCLWFVAVLCQDLKNPELHESHPIMYMTVHVHTSAYISF